MPRRFIHFCGASGVGKKTLFKKLVADSVPGLRERFGIDGQFGAYACYRHPGIKEMWKYVEAKEDIVLHNWQLATHGWIAHNMRVHPDVEQRVYLLWQPFEAHRSQFIERAIRDNDPDRPDVGIFRSIWNHQIVPLFRQVESWGLNVEVVDASKDLCDAIPEWPT